jgi:hypothetical protein
MNEGNTTTPVMDLPRTHVEEAWAFKGRVYCKAFTTRNDDVRQLCMYVLANVTLDTKLAAAKLADRILDHGDIDLMLWNQIKLIWESDHKPTRDELIAEGRRTGICQVCNRKLTNPKSVSAGIGPVCAGRI